MRLGTSSPIILRARLASAVAVPLLEYMTIRLRLCTAPISWNICGRAREGSELLILEQKKLHRPPEEKKGKQTKEKKLHVGRFLKNKLSFGPKIK